MGRKLWIGLAVGTLLLGAVPAWAAIINVPGDYITIQAAIDAATAGDTILVAAGNYEENVNVSKSITLTGAGAETTTIDAGPGGGTGVAITADDVILEGFKIINGVSNLTGVHLTNASGVIIRNNIISFNDVGICIQSGEGSSNTITGNTISNNFVGGIWIMANDNIITNNVITNNNGYGVLITGSNNRILGNDIRDNAAEGIYLEVCTDCVVDGNIVHHNDLVHPGIYLHHCSGIRISNNEVYNEAYGIYLAGSDDNTIQNNSIHDNGHGIFIACGIGAPSHRNKILGNSVVNNKGTADSGIHLTSDAWNTIINFNIIVGNSPEESGSYGVYNKNTYEVVDTTNNFWGDNSGPYHATNPGGTGDGVSNYVDFDPWIGKLGTETGGAEVEGVTGGEVKASSTETIQNGDLGVGADITTNDGGSATVQIVKYSGNPTSESGFLTEFEGAYYDLQVENPGNIAEIKFRLYYPVGSGLTASDKPVHWYNGSAWVICSEQQVVPGTIIVDGTTYGGYVEITINNTTSPSLSQLSGTPFGLGSPVLTHVSGGGGGCFIATAAFGSYQESHVWVLRQFRDRFLLTNTAGKAFVRFYYRHSPVLADWIAGREWTRAITRTLLLPLYGIAYLMLSGLGWVLLTGLLLAVPGFLVVRPLRVADKARIKPRAIMAGIALGLFFGLFFAASSLFALDANSFLPALGEEALTVTHTTSTLDKGKSQFGLFTGLATNPLKGKIGGSEKDLSKDQLLLTLSAAYGVNEKLQLGFSVPYLLAQESELAGVDKNGFGDIRLEGKYQFFGDKDKFGLAIVPFLILETGNDDAFLSTGSTAGGIVLIVDRNIGNHTYFAFNLGYQTQGDEEELPNFKIKNGLLFGAGVTHRLANKTTNLALEVKGRADGSSWFDKQEATPVEVIGSLTQKTTANTSLTLGLGTGLTEGYSSPDFRVLLGFRGRF